MSIIVRQLVLSYLWKVKDGKATLGNYILLRIRDSIAIHQIMQKTAYFDVTHLHENISLCCWFWFSMIHRSLLSRLMTIGWLGTQHKMHRKYHDCVSSSYSNPHHFACSERITWLHMITNPSQGLHMTGTTMWYHSYRQEYEGYTKKATI
jgi:hypothetical protein